MEQTAQSEAKIVRMEGDVKRALAEADKVARPITAATVSSDRLPSASRSSRRLITARTRWGSATP